MQWKWQIKCYHMSQEESIRVFGYYDLLFAIENNGQYSIYTLTTISYLAFPKVTDTVF